MLVQSTFYLPSRFDLRLEVPVGSSCFVTGGSGAVWPGTLATSLGLGIVFSSCLPWAIVSSMLLRCRCFLAVAPHRPE